MATVANVALSVSARTRNMQKGLKRAGRMVTGFAATVRRASTSVVGLAGAMTALAAGAGITMLVRQQFQAIDATMKLAQRTGDTTKALSGMQFAAEQSGMSVESFNRNIDVFSRRIGQAAQGTGQAQRAIDALGLKTEQLASMRPSEAILETAEAMQNVESSAERMAISADLFGRSGLEMVNMLAAGREGIEGMMGQADKLALTFDELAGNQVVRANDAMNAARKVFVGVARAVAIHLAPFVEALADKFTNAATSGEGMATRVSNGFEMVLKGIAHVAEGWRWVQIGAEGFKAAALQAVGFVIEGVAKLDRIFINVAETIVGTAKRIADAIPGISSELIDMAQDHVQSAKLANSGWQALGASLQEEAGKAAVAMDDLLNQGSRVESVGQFFDELRASARESAAEMMNNAAAMSEMELAVENAREVQRVIEGLQDRIDQATKSEREMVMEQLQAADATTRQIEQADALLRKMEEIEASKERQRKQTERMADLERFAQRVIEDQMTPAQKLADFKAQAAEALEEGLLTQEQWRRAIEDAADRFGDVNREIDRMRRAGESREVDNLARIAPSINDVSGGMNPNQDRVQSLLAQARGINNPQPQTARAPREDQQVSILRSIDENMSILKRHMTRLTGGA